MQIVAWTSLDGACPFYRLEEPLRCVADETGWDIEITKDITDFVRNDIPIDILIAQRPTGMKNVQLAGALQRERATRLVYEADDMIWKMDQWNPAVIEIGDEESIFWTQMCAMQSNVQTTTTERLADSMVEWSGNPRVQVLPNCVPERVFTQFGHNHRHPGPVVVGWAAGHSHVGDTPRLGPALRKLLRKRRNSVEFCMIGTDYRGEMRVDGRHISWVEDYTEYMNLVATFDVAVAPLSDTPFNHRKSAIKILEAASQGVPCVASKVGPYIDNVVDGETGFLVETDDEWYDALRKLTDNLELRAAMGDKARAWARSQTYERQVEGWIETYEEVLKQ